MEADHGLRESNAKGFLPLAEPRPLGENLRALQTSKRFLTPLFLTPLFRVWIIRFIWRGWARTMELPRGSWAGDRP